MSVEPFLQRIRAAFPQIEIKDFHVPVQGMDHFALVVNKEWIFRFPNRQEYFATFSNEVRLLEHLQDIVSLPIPHYTLLAADRSFGGYKMLEGDEFTDTVFRELSSDVQKKMGTHIAEFLTSLHSQTADELRDFGLPKTDYDKKFADLRKDYEGILSKHITKEEQKGCEWFFVETQKVMSQIPFVLVHSDFYWWHILINKPRTALSGVIDFGDACFGDAAGDFGGLWIYGREFVESIFAQYQGVKNDQFLYRSLLSFKRLGMSELLHALKGKFGQVDEAYTLFQKTLRAHLEILR